MWILILDVPAADILLAIAMIIRKALTYTYLTLFMVLGCVQDFGISTTVEEVEEILPTEVVIQSLIQPAESEELDVLVILDTSCSMSDNYEQVSRGIEILKDDIEMITFNYQIGFINSSLKDPYFVGPYDVLSTSIDLLLAPYELGRDSSETGFQAMYEFANTTEEGIEFLRESADKLIIFISDENEQSSIAPEIMHEWLKSEYKEVQHDVVSIVLTENSECSISYMTIGQKYIDLCAYYGKVGIDLCSDWEAWLSDSTFLAGPIDYINLKYTPVEDSIVVYLDKVIIEEWYYLPNTNTVYLDFIPSEGSLIEVGYVINPE